MLQLINASVSNATIENANITIPPATAGTIQEDSEQLAPGNTNIAPGAYEVTIYNTGLMAITVNGQTIEPNDKKEVVARENPVNNKFDFTPALLVVVPAGGSAYYLATRPSA